MEGDSLTLDFFLKCVSFISYIGRKMKLFINFKIACLDKCGEEFCVEGIKSGLQIARLLTQMYISFFIFRVNFLF